MKPAGRTTRRIRARRGFTLLELALSAGLLATLGVLIGAMLSQARQWSDDAGRGGGTMRVTRVIEALREQWGSRRSGVAVGAEGVSVVCTRDVLRFATSQPLIETDWPLVIANYEIEEDFESQTGSGRLWRLVYSESRVTDVKSAPGEDADAERAQKDHRLVLLKGCFDVRWERMAVKKKPEDLERPAGAGGAAKPERPVIELPPRPKPVRPGHTAAASKSEDLKGMKSIEWEDVGTEDEPPPMVRLSGIVGQEEFACALVVKASR